MSPALLFGAVAAGILTTLAPCVLPMLPVIVGGSIAPVTAPLPEGSGALLIATDTRAAARTRAFVIAASLGISVMVFTLLLKASTAFLGVPPHTWAYVSGGILIVLGLVGIFPAQWDQVSATLRLQSRSTQRLSRARDHQGLLGAVLTGAALGPVFSSCSPLYGYVVVTVLPASALQGLVLLIAYVVGLSGTLLIVSLLGQRAIQRLRWAADPHGWFRRGLGVVFVLVGIVVIFGWDKDIQAWILDNSPIQPWNLDTGFLPDGA